MVTVNQMMLFTNVLPPPVLTQIKCTLRTSSKANIIIIGSCSDTAVMLAKPLFLYRFGKSKINATRCLPLKLSVVKPVPGYSNISTRCLLCLHEKFEITNYPNQEELLNKRFELISKCRHADKYLLANCESNG